MMRKIPDIPLLKKYLNGVSSEDENHFVEEWLDDNSENAELLQHIAFLQSSPVHYSKEKVKSALLNKIESDLQAKKPTPKRFASQVHKRKKINPFFRVAAVIALIISGGFITYSVMQTNSVPQLTEMQTTSPSRTITQVTLSDGTVVELNANSTLYYPEHFPVHERVVRLVGEAFFDVTSDSLRPFKVATGELTTTVLGTQFNIQHLPNGQQTEVALVEGRVLVSIADTSEQEIILEPDQWIRYTPGSYITEVFEGVENKIVWRKSILEFEGRTLTEVVSILEAWYGISINTKSLEAGECQVVGTFKEESLENILNGLQFVTGINYELNEEGVTLSGGSCH